MTTSHLLIPCRARLPSLEEITDYLEGHGWALVPPEGPTRDCWAWPDSSGAVVSVPRTKLADYPRRVEEVIGRIAVIEGRELEDIARDLDLFERAP